MTTVQLDFDDALVGILEQVRQPLHEAAREIIVVELFRRGMLSGGKAAELLGLSRLEFVHRAADADIPYFSFTDEEWEEERRSSEQL